MVDNLDFVLFYNKKILFKNLMDVEQGREVREGGG